jgi:hypothetical protein
MLAVSPRLPAAVVASRRVDFARQSLSIALCALTAHALAYRSVLPEDGAHGYFAWYAPLVAAFSIAALVGATLALAITFTGGARSRPARILGALLPTRSADGPATPAVFRLATGALAFLTVQESLERSLSTGGFQLVSLTPSTLLVLVAGVLLTAGVVVLVERVVSSLADAVRRAPEKARRPARARWHVGPIATVERRRPLAVHGALRAPPPLLS